LESLGLRSPSSLELLSGTATWAGPVALTGVQTIRNDSLDPLRFSSTFSGPASITVTGPGPVEVVSSTVQGSATVSQATLAITGGLGATTVVSGGRLMAGGLTTLGAVTALNTNGNLTFDGSAVLAAHINAGANSRINVKGSVSLSNAQLDIILLAAPPV